jgi:hypothetical protein
MEDIRTQVDQTLSSEFEQGYMQYSFQTRATCSTINADSVRHSGGRQLTSQLHNNHVFNMLGFRFIS